MIVNVGGSFDIVILHSNSYIDVFSDCKMVEHDNIVSYIMHDNIVSYIISEQKDERCKGLKALENIESIEARKNFIRQAFESHTSDDRLLEYRESCEAVVDLVKKTSEYGVHSEFREYLQELGDMAANIPTRKAQIVFSAVRNAL